MVSAGDIKDDSGTEGGAGGKEKAIPTPLSLEDIKRYQKAFADSSKLAVEAGFDGIELHGARKSFFPGRNINFGLCQPADIA